VFGATLIKSRPYEKMNTRESMYYRKKECARGSISPQNIIQIRD